MFLIDLQSLMSIQVGAVSVMIWNSFLIGCCSELHLVSRVYRFLIDLQSHEHSCQCCERHVLQGAFCSVLYCPVLFKPGILCQQDTPYLGLGF